MDVLDVAEPEVEGDIGVGGGEVGGVVGGFAVLRGAAAGLEGDGDGADLEVAKGEKCGGWPPGGVDGVAERGGEGGEEALIGLEGQVFGGGGCGEGGGEGLGVGRGGGVAGFGEDGEDVREAGECVEADGMALLATDAGVVAEDDGEAAVGAGGSGKAGPGGGAVGGQGDAGVVRGVDRAAVAESGVWFGFGLEADGGGEEAAVLLGEDDVHGEVRGGEASRGLGPGFLPGAGEDELEDGGAGGFQGGGAVVVGAGGEGGGVEDDGGAPGF